MPTCIVPGCTSGYKSNPEKVHFFTIPRNPESEKLWKIAIRREHSCVKAGGAVCEKHFHKNEFTWQREYLGPNGQVLGVGKYKVPRLKKHCVPSLFPWVEETKQSQNENVMTRNEITDRTPSVIDSTLSVDPTEQINQESIKKEHLVSGENEITDRTPSFIDSALSVDPTEQMSEESIKIENLVPGDEAKFIEDENPLIDKDNISPEKEGNSSGTLGFTELLMVHVRLPLGWIKYETGCAGTRLIFFFTNETVKIEENFQMFPSKNIMLKQDMSIQIRIFGLLLKLDDFDIPNHITDIDELQNLLLTVHRFNVCKGVIRSSLTSEKSEMNLNTSIFVENSTGTWHHTSCPLLLRNGKICTHCNRSKNTLSRNQRRLARKRISTLEENILDVKEQKQQLSDFPTKYFSALQLAGENVKTLRCSYQDFEQYVKNENIPQNQLHVLNQIIEAAKHKRSKRRIYSKQWMLLSIFLHKRSPSCYKFLQSNNILPLPSIRMVRRFYRAHFQDASSR